MLIDLTPQECERVLSANHYAHLGYCENNEPYVVPITYAYSGGFFYGFTHEGHKIDVMRKNPKICIQVERIAGEHDWESVACWGLFEEVTDEKNIQDVKLLLAEHHGQAVLQGKSEISPLVEKLHERLDKGALMYRMKPYRMTGKGEKM